MGGCAGSSGGSRDEGGASGADAGGSGDQPHGFPRDGDSGTSGKPDAGSGAASAGQDERDKEEAEAKEEKEGGGAGGGAGGGGGGDGLGLDLPLRSLLADCGVLQELEGRLLMLDPPVTSRTELARLGAGREALLLAGLSADSASRARAAIAEAKQLPRHSSRAAPEELGAFLRERGLDDDLWRPILTRLGARRPSHLGAVRREHLEGEAIPPLQRDAFFRAVEGLPGASSGREGGQGAVAASPSQVLLAEPRGSAAEEHPSSLLGFVNFWLLKLYRDRPTIAIALVVVIIVAIVGGIVFGSISAADAVSNGES